MLCAWQAKAFHVLMCGDGGNDVGALKQADVGLALLSGYGNSNTVSPLTIRGPGLLPSHRVQERLFGNIEKWKRLALS